MSAQSTSLLGFGLYFIDVLACLLFCVTLALVGARFGREQTIDLDLPDLAASSQAGAELTGATITLRDAGQGVEVWLEDERIDFAELSARLARAPLGSVVVRSEESSLTRVIGIAHAAGVHDIRLAYEVAGPAGPAEPSGRRP